MKLEVDYGGDLCGTGGGTQGFTFDRYGNLTSKTGINPITLTTTASTNHMTSAAYDDRGNMATFTSGAGTQTLFHDLLNRQYRTVDTSGTDFTYLYDGGGERIGKFPTDLGATRREFARVIIEARGDSPLSCTPDPFLDVTCSANPNDGKYVQKMKDIGITSGCGGGNYCPDSQTQRDQSSVFFLKGEHCALNVNNCTYTPPSCTTTHVFADVACPSQYADWVGELYAEGITAGCGGNNFCPTQALGSWQMLAWAQKIWGTYNPLPRASVLTYRDEGARVITEANQTSSSGDNSEVITYPRDNVFLGTQLVSSAVWSGTTPNYQFYAVDHLGSIRLVTDISGNSVQVLKYWPYGDDGPGSGSDAGQRLKFDGMERDSENKHYFDHARTHDFNIGRFISADRLWGRQLSPQSWNRYSFVLNDPTALTDPKGLAATADDCSVFRGDCPWQIHYFGYGPDGGGNDSGPGEAGSGRGKPSQPAQMVTPPGPCRAQKAALGAKGAFDLGLGVVKLAMSGSAELTGPVGAVWGFYNALSGAGRIAAAFTEFLGAASGDVRNASSGGDFLKTTTSASGYVALIATHGDVEAAAHASSAETILTATITAALTGSPIDAGVSSTAKILEAGEIAESLSDIFGVNTEGRCY